jgi:hydrogenase maturation protease
VRTILVAAFGNELRGDDGFGIAVLRQLEATPPQGRDVDVRLVEVGTAGLWLAQQLLTPCQRLIILDAVSRGGSPGTVSVLKVDHVPDARDIDLHLAVPARALAVAKSLGALPPETFIVGCEPEEVDELAMSLSDAVSRAVPLAVECVRDLMDLDR